MRSRTSVHTGAVLTLAAALLTTGWSQSAPASPNAATAPLSSMSVADPDPTPTDPTATPTDPTATPTDPTSTPTDPTDPTGSWGDVPDPDPGTSEPVDPTAPPVKGGDGSGILPPNDPSCNARGCMMTLARYEVTNAVHNREKGSDNCNFYSGWWGNSGTAGNCPTYNGTKWRSNNWCADFSRWIWKNSGASVSGIDPWAGSFYRANKSNDHYHSKASGYTPVQGDAVLYDWDGSSASLGDNGWDIDHVGIFVKKKNSTEILAIEGNANGGATRDGVFQKTRPLRYVVGYVTPRF